MVAIVVLVLISRLLCAEALFLDTSYPLIYQSPQNDSYFGYSTLVYSKNNDTWIMVGAPKATNPLYPHVKRPGLLYKCSLSGPCLPFQVDKRVGNKESNFIYDFKQDAMLGATLIYQEVEDFIVACAPNWKSNRTGVVGIEGACYSFNGHPDAAAPQKWIPLLTNPYRCIKKHCDYNNIFSQFGMSAAVTKKMVGVDKTTLIVGSPGKLVWRGCSILFDIGPPFKSIISKRSIGGDSILQNMRESSMNTSKMNDYAGYSLAAGRFYRPFQQLYAIGAPRSLVGYGSVMIMDINKNDEPPRQTIPGKIFGGNFGSNLGVGDINNDGLDDLLIASPMLSTPTVFLYFSNGKNSLVEPNYGIKKLQYGSDMNSRFGAAIVVEDLDMDTHEEVLVGAPNADNGKGIVAIWVGIQAGLSSDGPPDIILRASDFYPYLRGFGASIALPFDLDGNLYPEVAVGSYLSGHVVLFRGRPEIKLNVVFEDSNNIRFMPGARKLSFRICTIYNSTVNYEFPEIKLRRTIVVDNNLRRFNISTNDRIKIYSKKKGIYDTDCENFQIIMKDNSHNIVDPVLITIDLALLDYPAKRKYVLITNEINQDDDKFQKLYPKAVDVKASLEVPFVRGCGTNNICEADLSLKVFTMNKMFTLGSKDIIRLIINVTNVGEPAYNTEIEINLPEQTSLANLPSNCKFNTKVNISCNVMNPLLDQTTKSIPIDVDMRSVTGVSRSLIFRIEAGGNYEEKNPKDNVLSYDLELNVDASLAIAGKSQQTLYVNTKTEEYVRFQHVFEIQKLGVSPVELVQVTANVPYLFNNNQKSIKFLEVEEALSELNKNIFNCAISNQSETDLNGNINDKNDKTVYKHYSKRSLNSEQFLNEKIETENGTLTIENLPANRTMNLNCEDEFIKCHKINCTIGPFKNSQSVGHLILSMKLDIAKIKGAKLGLKDIFVLKTTGKTSIIGIYKKTSSKIDTSLIFISSPPVSKVAPWLIAIAVILGLLLLSLLIIGLMKAGFFERKKKQELDKLRTCAQSQETTDDFLEDIPEEDIQTQLEA